MSNALTSRSSSAASAEQGSPAWFFRFFAVYAVGMLVPLGLQYVDFFGHLWEPDPNWDSPIYRGSQCKIT
jgi:hypothetical protein